MATRVRIHRAQTNQLLRAPGGAVHRHVSELTRKTEAAAKSMAPVDSGKGRSSITAGVVVQGGKVVGRVSTPLDYMLYQHEGTGVYAGKGPIRPKRADYLVFKPKKRGPARRGDRSSRGPLVFAKEVKGVPPNPFLVDALKKVSPYPVRRD